MSASEQTMLSAQVPLYLRDDLHQLAQQHDRSVSAEIREALRTHVLLSRSSGGPPFYSSRPFTPAERHAPEDPAVEAQAPTGEGR